MSTEVNCSITDDVGHFWLELLMAIGEVSSRNDCHCIWVFKKRCIKQCSGLLREILVHNNIKAHIIVH